MRTDGIPAGLPLYRAGSFNDPNYVSDLFNGGGSSPISSCNMDTYKEVLYAAGLPALISIGITLLYLLLKAYQFAVYALPHQTEKEAGSGPRQVVVNKSTAQLRETKAAKKFLNKCPELFQMNMAQSSNNPPGTVPLSRGWEKRMHRCPPKC